MSKVPEPTDKEPYNKREGEREALAGDNDMGKREVRPYRFRDALADDWRAWVKAGNERPLIAELAEARADRNEANRQAQYHTEFWRRDIVRLAAALQKQYQAANRMREIYDQLGWEQKRDKAHLEALDRIVDVQHAIAAHAEFSKICLLPLDEELEALPDEL